MLSDTLFDLEESLKSETLHYTSEPFSKVYNQDVRDEIDDILSRISALRKKLDRSDFEGSYRF
jgi:hypothetical protein